MARYFSVFEPDPTQDGVYGVIIPQLPGCVAMGDDYEDAFRNAVEALRDWTEVMLADGGSMPAPMPIEDALKERDRGADLANGALYALVPLVEHGRPVKANLSIDSGVLAAIDAAADRQRITRSAMVEIFARKGLAELA